MVEVKKLHCCHCLLWLHVYTVTSVYVKQELLMAYGKVVSSVSTRSSATAAKAAGLPSGMIVLTISYVHTCSITTVYSAPNSART